MARATIKLPALYSEIADCSGRVAIEHAALDCRIHETFLALALSIPGEVAFFTDNLERIRFRLDEWLHGEKSKRRSFFSGKFFNYRVGVTSLWIVTPAARAGEVFFGPLEAGFVTNAHLFEDDLVELVEAGRGSHVERTLRCVYVAGQYVGKEHWFYRYCHGRHEGWGKAPRLLRLDGAAVAKAFPDQGPRILPRDDPRYPAAMCLRDPAPRESAAPILTFARRRLKIRTDRPPWDLTELQRKEVGASLEGASWESGTSSVVSLDMNRVQRRILASKRLGRRRGFRKFLVVKYRGAGVSVLEQAESYYHCLKRPRSYVASVAHLGDTVERLFETVRTFAEKDPYSPGIRNETSENIFFENGSYFFIGTGKSDGLLRGDRIQRFHGSEVPYWRKGARSLASMDLLMAGVLEAARFGEIVLEGTPRGVEWMCTKYRESKAGLADYWPIFVPWFLDPTCRLPPGAFDEEELRDTLTTAERDLMARFRLTIGQIAFRRAKKKEHGALFPQEFPEDDESCFLSAGAMYFNADVVTELARTVPDAPKKMIPGGYEIRWEEPKPGIEYVAGCDTSEGIAGGDPNGVGVLRRDTLEQVAAVHGLFGTKELAQHAVRLCVEYNRALLGVERENHGHAVLDRIDSLGYGKAHSQGGPLFYHGAELGVGSRKKVGKRGWSTNSETRPRLLSDLATSLEEGALKVRDRQLVSELTTFCRQANGRWEHDDGAHDDAIFKWGIALQMTKHRKLRPRLTFLEGRI